MTYNLYEVVDNVNKHDATNYHAALLIILATKTVIIKLEVRLTIIATITS